MNKLEGEISNSEGGMTRRNFIIGLGMLGAAAATVGLSELADRYYENRKKLQIIDFQQAGVPARMTLPTDWIHASTFSLLEWQLMPAAIPELHGVTPNAILRKGWERTAVAMPDDKYEESLDKYADDMIRDLKFHAIDNQSWLEEELRVENEIKEVAKTKVDNLDAIRIDYSKSFSSKYFESYENPEWLPTIDNPRAEGVLMNRIYIVRSKDNKIFEILYFAPPADFKKGVAEFDKMVQTFKVLPDFNFPRTPDANTSNDI